MPDDPRRPDQPETYRLLERMLFFSDAVFAIVLTLLVLDLRLPAGVTDATLFRGLLAMTPTLIAFTQSFAVLSVFWIAHASTMRRLLAFDWAVAWVNLAFLFTITWTPFVSTMVGQFNVFGNAWRLYCVAMIAMGIGIVVLMLVIHRGHGRLIGGVSRREFRHRLTRAFSPAAAFTLALALSLMGLARFSYLSAWMIPVILIFARLAFGPKGDKTAASAGDTESTGEPVP